MKRAISAAQCRAGRALVGLSREQLAALAGVPTRTLADFELSNTGTRAGTVDKLILALEAVGVEFIQENGGGAGVRLRRANEGSVAP